MIMDELLAKYLLGETTDNEQKQVASWIASKEENKKHFEQFKTIWEQSKAIELQSTIDPNDAWQRFETMIADKNTTAPLAKAKVVALYWKRFAIAACVVISIGIAGYFFLTSGAKFSSGDQVVEKILPDHSVITLNKNSTLSYSKSFNKKTRQVNLSGEAFFKVSPDKMKPFVIEVSDVTVTVVGTSFNIDETQSGVTVIVESGIVEVQAMNHRVKLSPQQKIFIAKGSAELNVQPNHDELYNYFRTNQFTCRNTPLKELVDALNKNFDSQIEITNPAIANLKLTSQFQKENLQEILSIIAATLNVTVDYQKSGKILIK